jgi:hypothetical protein
MLQPLLHKQDVMSRVKLTIVEYRRQVNWLRRCTNWIFGHETTGDGSHPEGEHPLFATASRPAPRVSTRCLPLRPDRLREWAPAVCHCVQTGSETEHPLFSTASRQAPRVSTHCFPLRPRPPSAHWGSFLRASRSEGEVNSYLTGAKVRNVWGFTYTSTIRLNDVLLTYRDTNPMKKSSPWKADSFSSVEEISCILCNWLVQYPPLYPILSQMNPASPHALFL